MIRACLLIALVSLATASLPAATWQKVNAGPFEIYTNQDVRQAKQLLGTLEHLRYQVEALTGTTDPKPLWPIRIIIATSQRPTSLRLTTAFQSLVMSDASLSIGQRKQIAEALLFPNTGPLDKTLEAALLTVLSRLESSGSRVTLGALPSPAEQTPDWVLVNYLITNDLYRGRLRVFLGNLMRGADKASALRNGFEKDEAALRQDAESARAAFAPVTFAAKPILPERDYRARDIEEAEGRLQLAIAQLDGVACATSQELAAVECLAAANNRAADALKAIELGSKNARMYYLAAVNQEDRLERQKQIFTALQLKPIYPEAAFAFAVQERDPLKALKALKDASPAAQRDVKYQSRLAQIAEAAFQFPDAAKAWGAAERAAVDPAERERLHQSRLRTQDQRLEAEAQARRDIEEARLKDIERVRQESLGRIRLAEAKARATMTPLGPDEKVAEWWDGDQANASFVGTLTRIECIGGGKARFAFTGEKEFLLLDVADASRIVVSGSGAETLQFTCGLQKNPRKVRAAYLSTKAIAPPATAAAPLIDPNFTIKPKTGLTRRPSPDEAPTPVPAAKSAKPKPVPKLADSPTAGRLLTLELIS